MRILRPTLIGSILVCAASSVTAASSATLSVNNSGDSGNGTCATTCTLRDAIANVGDGGTITFDPAMLPATITLLKGQLTVSGNLSILGPGAGALSISAALQSRVVLDNGPGNIAIADVTLRDGLVVGFDGQPGVNSRGDNAMGGCLYVASGTALSLQRVSIRNCTANAGDGAPGASTTAGSGGGALGGAIYLAGNLVLDETSIIDAHALAGKGGAGADSMFGSAGDGGYGGLACGGAICLGAHAILVARNATISTASATGGDGGAGGISNFYPVGGKGRDGGPAHGGLVGREQDGPMAIFDFSTLAEGVVAGGGGGAAGNGTATAGQPGMGDGAALYLTGSTGSFGGTAIVGSQGAQSCSGSVSSRANSSNLADDPSCGANVSASLSASFRPLAANAAIPHYMPVRGGPAVDAASACVDYDNAAVTFDGQGTLRPQGEACDIGAIEADYIFVSGFD